MKIETSNVFNFSIFQFFNFSKQIGLLIELMKRLYETSNTVEAHMILNLLEQSGIIGRIDGEYLQGGVGDLPAMGLIRVMVNDADYNEADQIVTEWDSAQPVQIKNKPIKKSNHLTTGVLGFILGSILIGVIYNTPVTNDGIDYNDDGQLDEKWTYINNRISKTELDRNFDGKIDLIYKYDRRGLIEFGEADDDFNGEFETKHYYRLGNTTKSEIDTNGDGFYDNQISYIFGVMDEFIFLNKLTNKPIKIQKYNSMKLISAKIDTNGDGILDTSYNYDELEEIIK